VSFSDARRSAGASTRTIVPARARTAGGFCWDGGDAGPHGQSRAGGRPHDPGVIDRLRLLLVVLVGLATLVLTVQVAVSSGGGRKATLTTRLLNTAEGLGCIQVHLTENRSQVGKDQHIGKSHGADRRPAPGLPLIPEASASNACQCATATFSSPADPMSRRGLIPLIRVILHSMARIGSLDDAGYARHIRPLTLRNPPRT
jgi:hypothetical protein